MHHPMKAPYMYNAKIIRVVDGDTYKAELDLGFTLKMKITIRLKDGDTPETFHPINEIELKHGEAATEFAKKTLLNRTVVIKVYKAELYNRYLADVIVDGKQFSEMLKENNLLKLPKEEYLKAEKKVKE